MGVGTAHYRHKISVLCGLGVARGGKVAGIVVYGAVYNLVGVEFLAADEGVAQGVRAVELFAVSAPVGVVENRHSAHLAYFFKNGFGLGES